MLRCERDYWPTEAWLSSDAASLGMDEETLSKIDGVIRKEYKNINSIVVVRKGYIAYEKYYHGYGATDAQHVASVTKSVISALIGICIDKGFILSIDQKVMDFFPEYKGSGTDIRKQSVTLRHILTMTAPFAFSIKSIDSKIFEPLDRLRRQRDWVKYIIELMGVNSQIGRFQYSTAGAHLLSAIITRVTGMCACQLANEHLFRQLGMQIIPDYDMRTFKLENMFGEKLTGWIKDPQKNSVGGWGLTLSPHDMARFGLLYLNGGKWGGRQVISEQWIDESIKPNSNGYGYLWWLGEESPIMTFSARGDGGNMISCIPEKDLVVITTADFVTKPPDSWRLVKEYILPSVLD